VRDFGGSEEKSVEIIPGVGLPVARVGQTLADIEAMVGLADDIQADPDRAYWHRHKPAFVAHFDREGLVELIEVYYSEGGEEQVTLDGTQLTYRLMDEVMADLQVAGRRGRRMVIGFDFDDGFCVWSMSSLSPSDLTGGSYDPDDERAVVEGVSVGAPDYFTDPARASPDRGQ